MLRNVLTSEAFIRLLSIVPFEVGMWVFLLIKI